MDWGRDGAAAISTEATVAVVVDVLSFTTSVSVALDAGITVLPYRWDEEGGSAYAAQHDADPGLRQALLNLRLGSAAS